MEKKKILISGAGGFIGRNLREGLAADYNIIAPTSKELDLLNTKQVKKFLEHGAFDAVIHCATHNATANSQKDTSLVLNNNLLMFFNLASCHELYSQMLYFGSGAEYGREFMPPKVMEDYFGSSMPTDDYGFSKYICNLAAQNSDNIYNLTLFGCFGKYEDWEIRFISNACAKAVNGMDITIKQNVKFDYLYINDLVKIVRYFIKARKLKFKKYNVCSGHSIDLQSLAQIVLKVSEKNLNIKIAQRGLGREYSGSNERLLREFKYFKFTPMEKAIEELYKWYQDHRNKISRDLLLKDK